MAFSKSAAEFHHVKFHHLQTRQMKSIEKGTSDENSVGGAQVACEVLSPSPTSVPGSCCSIRSRQFYPKHKQWEQSLVVFVRDLSPHQPQRTCSTHSSLNKQEPGPSACKQLCYLNVL